MGKAYLGLIDFHIFPVGFSWSQRSKDYQVIPDYFTTLQVRWKVDGKIHGFEYSFADYIVKGYSVQDHVQVAAAIQLAFQTVQDLHPAAKKIIIQSDNASGFASQELIPFTFNMNIRLHYEKSFEQMDIHRSIDW